MDINEAPVCWSCIVGFHDECYAPELVQPEEIEDALSNDDNWVVCCCVNSKVADANAFATEKRGVGRPMLDPEDITDILSTGRKRAAMVAPITDGMLCEWAGLKFAGGGVEPIVGCDSNRLSNGKGPDKGDRHHGPNKNVLDNKESNLHRICSRCHNRYHAQNNKYYLGERPPVTDPWLPIAPEGMEVFQHDPDTLATAEEIEENEIYWASRKTSAIDTED